MPTAAGILLKREIAPLPCSPTGADGCFSLMNPSVSLTDRPLEFVSWSRDRWMFDDGGVVLLMYHKIADAPPTTNLPILYVSAPDFARQMEELTAAGLACVPYGEARSAIDAGQRAFCVTFDDGFCNVFDYALPTLRARSLRSIQFIVAGQIGGEDAWDRAIGEPPQPLMDDAQIRDWLAAGQEIGCHTLTHPHLPTLSRERARAEIFDSKKLLEDRFGVPIRHFCYPYGDYNEAIRDLVGEAGYDTAPTVRFGTNRPGGDPLEWHRVMACQGRTPLDLLARKVARRMRRQP